MMNRLLAYLFIVLGLGLTFNVSAHAYVIEVCNFGVGNYLVKKHTSSNSYSKESVFKYANSKNLNCETHFRNDDKDLYKAINKELKKTKYKLKWAGDLKNISRQFTHTIFDQKYKKIAKRFNYTLGKHLPKKQTIKKQTQIAKAEPNQSDKYIPIKFCAGGIAGHMTMPYFYSPSNYCSKLSYHQWIKTKKGWASDPGPVQLCYRPWNKKVLTNQDKEHVTHVLLDQNCGERFYKVKYFKTDNGVDYFVKGSTQLAKAEPSQTQKVAKNNTKYPELLYFPDINSGMKLPNIANEGDVYKYLVTNLTNNSKWFESINSNKKIAESEALIKCKKYFKDTNTDDACLINSISILNENSNNIVKQYFVWDQQKLLFYDKTKTQIAKAEPSQTQKVAKKDVIFIRSKGYGHDNSIASDKELCDSAETMARMDALASAGVANEISFSPNSIVSSKVLNKKFDYTVPKYETGDKKKYRGCGVNVEIVIKKPSLQPKKKKVKVVKKEPKQEEFKPKKTNQDNEAPVIEIAENITVDSQAYTLKGKVKDKSQIYLTINGRQVDVKKGKFELDRFSIDPDVAEELKIVAIDQWNNKSEKIVKVTIDLQSSDIAKVYEELKPNNVKVKTDNNKIAIIIGIEKYENLKNLDAKYANRDAKAFRTYAARALGIKPSNIKMLIDDKATRSQALKAFKLWLPKIAGKGGKDIHIFFAGHGLASDNGEDLYILPQDGESSLLEDTAISRVELISLINKVNPKSVTMFFDTCYSGQTRDERMLVASLRPIRIVADEQETPDNFTIFTASNYDQTSGSIEEAEHGMFSYYLMKGLEGKADENKDKKITNGELITYLKDNVSQEAFTQNRQQDPMLAGDPDKILIKF